MQIDTSKLLEIIGSKEVELNLLRNHVIKLEKELDSYKSQKQTEPLKTEPVE